MQKATSPHDTVNRAREIREAARQTVQIAREMRRRARQLLGHNRAPERKPFGQPRASS